MLCYAMLWSRAIIAPSSRIRRELPIDACAHNFPTRWHLELVQLHLSQFTHFFFYLPLHPLYPTNLGGRCHLFDTF